MSWLFFNSASQTFRLSPQGNGINDLPAFCCKKSNQYPYRITEVSQIFPSLIKLNLLNNSLFPLFNRVDRNFNPIDQYDLPFFLVCTPSQTFPPHAHRSVVSSDYWRNVQPMILCQNRLGYYLGKYNDEHSVLFQVCEEKSANGYLLFNNTSDSQSVNEFGYSFSSSTISVDMPRIWIKQIIKIP